MGAVGGDGVEFDDVVGLQLGEILQLPPRTLKDQAAAGVLPHHRFGKHYRFSRSDISAILRLTQQSEKPRRRRLNVV